MTPSVGPTWISVPIWSPDPAVETGRPAVLDLDLVERILPVLPEPFLVQPESRWSHGRTSFSSRSRVVYQSTSTPTASAQLIHRSKSKYSLQPSNRPPSRQTASMTGPTRRSPRARRPPRFRAGRRGTGIRWHGRKFAVRADLFPQERQPMHPSAATPTARPTGTACGAWGRSLRSTPCTGCPTSGDLAPGADDLLGHGAICSTSSSGLCRQPAHEVELHLPPPGGSRQRPRCGWIPDSVTILFDRCGCARCRPRARTSTASAV